MITPGSRTTASAAERREWYRARVRAGWSDVRVEDVGLVTGVFDRRARAVIHLGALSPMEVCVELLPVSTGDAAIARGDDARMWSTHSQENGCFVYERSIVLDGTNAPSEWMIRVRPTESMYLPPIQRRFHAGEPER